MQHPITIAWKQTTRLHGFFHTAVVFHPTGWKSPCALIMLTLMLAASPLQTSDAAPGSMSKQQAYRLLTDGNSPSVSALPAGDREILLAKLALDEGNLSQAIRILSSARLEKNKLAALLRAEAYRRQSVAAARRAGHYAHAVSSDIGKLQHARLNVGLDQAEARLQAFIAGHTLNHPVSTKPVAIAASTRSDLMAGHTLSHPVSTKPVAIAASTPSNRLPVSVHQAVQSWRKDWESLNADAYLSHYHPGFRTKKHDYKSWSSYKRRINSHKKFIKVKLSDLRMLRGPEKISEGEAILVAFKQQYESSNYAVNSRKQLYLVRKSAGSKWLILFEGGVLPSYHRSGTKVSNQISVNSKPVLAASKAGAWAINLGSFDSPIKAEQMASGIKLTGPQQPFVSSAEVSGKAVHRVRIGLYQSRSEAVEAMIRICPELSLTNCWLEQVKK